MQSSHCGLAGSIPACAGETRPFRLGAKQGRVYPRVCGGNMDAVAWYADWPGLSPRVRGKPTC